MFRGSGLGLRVLGRVAHAEVTRRMLGALQKPKGMFESLLRFLICGLGALGFIGLRDESGFRVHCFLLGFDVDRMPKSQHGSATAESPLREALPCPALAMREAATEQSQLQHLNPKP